MYCINCGKEIDGNIPICGQCLQGILDKHKAEQDILTQVNLEAQLFHIKEGKEDKEDTTVEEWIPNTKREEIQESDICDKEDFHGDAPTKQKDPSENSTFLITTIMAIIIIVVIVFIIIDTFR